ncbi:MAG: aminoacyl-tRNA hydrolase [Deltaproteobacteria bacterium]|nr:aminoacyl-tRNA hydrolase [Deltaproteobacteria bacterium]
MTAPLHITSGITVPASELTLRFSRSSGAGGQNVNKVNSKASLIWSPTSTRALSPSQISRFTSRFGTRINVRGELRLSCDAHRDQAKNIEECYRRLASMIREILAPPKKRVKTKPGKAVKERLLQAKKRRSLAKASRRRPAVD